MVPSSADIVIQNRRISLSETSTINIYDVVNTMAINGRTMACALMPTNYFVVVVLPSRQIKRVVRLKANGL